MADTFRKEYIPLTDGQKEIVKKIKEKAEELETLFNDANTPNIGREIALAKTNLEQSVMWAVKGITTTGLIEAVKEVVDSTTMAPSEA